ncbi:TPA: restriction endonuclease subunit S [Klebsiella pneumoniae]|nr:restriction endonuclease subunit S [Klebsiella pneumoniae]HBW5756937.1 restriction endonuclease subunit S [Klebsiella pneumoniae]HBW5993142.1 restriction endonuclease subunit S [Klebsiella pneumoniae]HBW6917975.1 restriction endonuclease subunit S [Klebsiella pneumoniae]
MVVPKELSGWNVPRAIAVIRVKEDIGAEWVNLCLQTKEVAEYLDARANTTVQKTLNLKDVREIPILLPPPQLKSAIENVALGISKKIQCNNKTNQTLEQMAQALFKSWFVDFEPVKAKMAVLEAGGSQEDATLATMTAISGKDADALAVFEREHPEQYAELKTTAELFPSAMQDSELGEIPVGWMVNSTSEHYSISIGKTPPRKEAQWFSINSEDLKWVSIKDMGIASTYISETSERLTHEAVKKFNIKVMPANTVFLSFKLTVGRVCITTEEMCSNEAIAHFTPKENKYESHWLYHALKSFDFNKLGSTSSIATAVNSKTIKEMKLIFPNEIIAKKYTKKVSSIMKLQQLNSEEINGLTQLRDTLLPKLLSGEITLPEAEQIISEEA